MKFRTTKISNSIERSIEQYLTRHFQDADYFIHLKEQFPLFPKRYHSTSLSEIDPCQIEVGTSPVSGELNLADALQMECESIVEQPLPQTSHQGGVENVM